MQNNMGRVAEDEIEKSRSQITQGLKSYDKCFGFFLKNMW